jgi:hypothetical protein
VTVNDPKSGTGETVVLDDITVYGLHRKHIVKMGSEPVVEDWIEAAVPAEAVECLQTNRYFEDGLDIHHLWMYWNAREVVKLTRCAGQTDVPPVQEVVFWWIGPCVPMRLAIDLAAGLFEMRLGRKPTQAWVQKLPKGATPCVDLTGPQAGQMVELKEAEWVPKGYVVIGD